MALNSGIKCNQVLIDTVQSTNLDFGYIIMIKNEEFILEKVLEEKSSFQESLEKIAYPLEKSFYLLVKKENLLVTFIPDTAIVREKMLYASSKGLLSKELGLGGVKWDLSSLAELTHEGYLEFTKKEKPYSACELEMQKVKNDLALVDTSSNVRQGHIVGLSYRVQDELSRGIQALKDRGAGGLVFVS